MVKDIFRQATKLTDLITIQIESLAFDKDYF